MQIWLIFRIKFVPIGIMGHLFYQDFLINGV